VRIGGIGIATVNARGWDGSAWQNLAVISAAFPQLKSSVCDPLSATVARVVTPADGASNLTALLSNAYLSAFNGSTWDRLRCDPSKHLDVNIGGLANLAYAQVSISTSATTIKAANTSRKAITIKNIGSVDVYLGNGSVTTANGYKLAPGEALSDIRTTAAIYGIVASGSGSVCYWEE